MGVSTPVHLKPSIVWRYYEGRSDFFALGTVQREETSAGSDNPSSSH